MSHQWNSSIERNVAISMSYLEKTHKLLAENGVPLVVTGVPNYPQYTGEWSSRAHEVLGETAERAGFSYFNTFEILKPEIEGSDIDEYYWRTDPTHFNEKGNRIWSRIHLEHFQKHPQLLFGSNEPTSPDTPGS